TIISHQISDAIKSNKLDISVLPPRGCSAFNITDILNSIGCSSVLGLLPWVAMFARGAAFSLSTQKALMHAFTFDDGDKLQVTNITESRKVKKLNTTKSDVDEPIVTHSQFGS